MQILQKVVDWSYLSRRRTNPGERSKRGSTVSVKAIKVKDIERNFRKYVIVDHRSC